MNIRRCRLAALALCLGMTALCDAPGAKVGRPPLREIDFIVERGVSYLPGRELVAYTITEIGDCSVHTRGLGDSKDRVVWTGDRTGRTAFDYVQFSGELGLLGFVELVCQPSPWRFYIRLLGLDGKEVKSIRQGCYFDWSPDGRSIAYIGGKYADWGDYDFRAEGVWVYDVKEGSSVQVFGPAYRLEWAEFDNRLYIQDAERSISKYDVRIKKLESTAHRGLLFSPDGQYYGVPAVDFDLPFRVFQRETEQEFTGTKDCVITPLMQWSVNLVRWLDNRRIKCTIKTRKALEWGWKAWDYVVDIETGEIRGSTDRIVAFREQTEEVLLLKDGVVFEWKKLQDLVPVTADMIEALTAPRLLERARADEKRIRASAGKESAP